MSAEEILLIMTGGVLTVLALVASYFLGGEAIRALRDIAANRPRPASGEDEGFGGPIRRIIPFRDRKTVQRVIDYLEEDEGEAN